MAMLRNTFSREICLVTRRTATAPYWSPIFGRLIRHQAFESGFDAEELAEAREWHSSFKSQSLPKGQTSFSRSGGPGGQHVNKTETKATTVWPLSELRKVLPKMLHSTLLRSKYYVKNTNVIMCQAQTQRSRSANTDENQRKLVEEIQRMYRETVPGVTSEEKMRKYEALEKAFHRGRLDKKKQHSTKKASRKGHVCG